MNPETQLLKGSTPALILAVLRDGPLHGYGIARRIEAMTGGQLSLNDGSIYPTLHRLESEGALRAEWRGRGRPRKLYHLTRRGRKLLAERREKWSSFVQAVQIVLEGSHG